jgi:hypothetical protein
MGARLGELGFTDVVELDWGDETRIGDITVHALPFFGEQPTDSTWLHPEVRNLGCTYLVETPDLVAAFLADSGRDAAGDSRAIPSGPAAALARPDIVFSGYRSWRMRAAQHLFTSVARYLLFVPPEQWARPMQLMNGAPEAVEVAREWGARHLVPYADGGAPWFWEIGLGPRLDGRAHEVPDFDPFPERVVDAAHAGAMDDELDVLVLRPNDSLLGWDDEGGPQRVRLPGNSWPYADPTSR